MKHLFAFLFIIGVLFVSCNNNKKNTQATEGAKDAQLAETSSPDWQKKIEELQQLTPYTIDQLRALLPSVLAGDSATGIETSTNMGTGFARAVYEGDSSSLELNVFDCGGNAGAGIYQAQFINQLGIQDEGENEYTRVVDFNNGKAIEHANKETHAASLTYMHDRLLVMLEGKNKEPGELKILAKGLKLK
jgi:hypothetical protein